MLKMRSFMLSPQTLNRNKCRVDGGVGANGDGDVVAEQVLIVRGTRLTRSKPHTLFFCLFDGIGKAMVMSRGSSSSNQYCCDRTISQLNRDIAATRGTGTDCVEGVMSNPLLNRRHSNVCAAAGRTPHH